MLSCMRRREPAQQTCSLIEPDAVHQAFDGAVEIGIFKNDEGRLAAQFERKPLVTVRGRAADGAAHFR